MEAIPRRHLMSNPDTPRHVEVKDGDQTIAAAEVTTAEGAEGTARTSLHASSGHNAPGSRASLVDAIMDLPEVQASTRLEATVPPGDAQALERRGARTEGGGARPGPRREAPAPRGAAEGRGRRRGGPEDAVPRPVGPTALFDANLPADSGPE